MGVHMCIRPPLVSETLSLSLVVEGLVVYRRVVVETRDKLEEEILSWATLLWTKGVAVVEYRVETGISQVVFRSPLKGSVLSSKSHSQLSFPWTCQFDRRIYGRVRWRDSPFGVFIELRLSPRHPRVRDRTYGSTISSDSSTLWMDDRTGCETSWHPQTTVTTLQCEAVHPSPLPQPLQVKGDYRRPEFSPFFGWKVTPLRFVSVVTDDARSDHLVSLNRDLSEATVLQGTLFFSHRYRGFEGGTCWCHGLERDPPSKLINKVFSDVLIWRHKEDYHHVFELCVKLRQGAWCNKFVLEVSKMIDDNNQNSILRKKRTEKIKQNIIKMNLINQKRILFNKYFSVHSIRLTYINIIHNLCIRNFIFINRYKTDFSKVFCDSHEQVPKPFTVNFYKTS